MRCLFLAAELASIGGMQQRDRLLIKAMDAFFSQRGRQLIVYSLNDPPSEPPHVELRALRATQVVCFGGNRRRFSLEALHAFTQASIVFYGLLGFAPLVFFQRVLAPKSRRFLLLHGVEAWQRRGGPHAVAVRQMTGSIAISRYTLERFRHVYTVPTSQLGFVLPNSLGPDMAITASAGSSASSMQDSDAPRLLSVARLAAEERYKGIDTVIQALPSLLKTFPGLIYVVIGDGSDKLRLEHLAQQLRVAHAIQFRGFVSEEE